MQPLWKKLPVLQRCQQSALLQGVQSQSASLCYSMPGLFCELFWIWRAAQCHRKCQGSLSYTVRGTGVGPLLKERPIPKYFISNTELKKKPLSEDNVRKTTQKALCVNFSVTRWWEPLRSSSEVEGKDSSEQIALSHSWGFGHPFQALLSQAQVGSSGLPVSQSGILHLEQVLNIAEAMLRQPVCLVLRHARQAFCF